MSNLPMHIMNTHTSLSTIVLRCSIFLVFEYCTHDLGRLVDAMPRPFSPSEVKCLMLQVRLPSSGSGDPPQGEAGSWAVTRPLQVGAR